MFYITFFVDLFTFLNVFIFLLFLDAGWDGKDVTVMSAFIIQGAFMEHVSSLGNVTVRKDGAVCFATKVRSIFHKTPMFYLIF